MGRIGAQLNGIERALLNRLAEANSAINLSTLRRAEGRRILSPRDDVSAFTRISRMQSDLASVTATLTNLTNSSSLVGKLQSQIGKIRTQLDAIRLNAVADENQQLDSATRAANQSTIDTAIGEIQRLATEHIDGRPLLEGSADFDSSGVNNSQVIDLQVFGVGGSGSRTISGSVSVAATQATLTNTGTAGNIDNTATFTLTGDRGTASITVTNGEALTAVRDRINLEAHQSGVVASVNGDDLVLTSIEFGSDADVQVAVTSGTFVTTGGSGNGTAKGADAQAVINGRTLTGSGNHFDIFDNGFHFTVEFAGGFTGTFDQVTVSGAALSFAVSPDLTDRATLAVRSLLPHELGGLSGSVDQLLTGGAKSGLGTLAPDAIRIVDEALDDLVRIEGLVDGFATQVIDSSQNLLTDVKSDLDASILATDGFDDTEEALLIAKNQALAINALSSLSILDQQRLAVVSVIKQIAGLI